jgi:beta-N-acetylhexosaminidase
MTIDQKVRQMIMPSFRFWKPDDTEALPAETMARKLGEQHFGGIILFSDNIVSPEQTASFLRMVRKANSETGGAAPYFFAIDQEGGRSSRLTGGTMLCGNMALGAANDESIVAETTQIIGSEISEVGFNVDFAPVLDVNDNPDNPIIGIRSFSDDPEIVAHLGRSFIKGLQGQGIMTAAKHFPGHGNTAMDSHVGLPVVDRSLEELQKTELVPFKAASDITDMMMTAHIQFPQIEKDTYVSKETGEKVFLPATLSKTIISDVLRKDLGFDGVVVTDAMVMGAISRHFDPLDAAMIAINAGVDLILMPMELYSEASFNAMDDYISAIVRMVEEGKIPKSRIDESVGRILALKEKHKGQDKPKWISDWRSHAPFRWRAAFKSVTLLKNRNRTIPLSGKERVLVICPSVFARLSVEESVGMMERSAIIPEEHVIDIRMESEAGALPPNYDVYVVISENKCDVRIPEGLGKKTVFISACLPYDNASATDYDAVLACYGYAGAINLCACFSALFGTFSPKGRLPVAVPGPDGNIVWPRGSKA